MPSDGMKLRNGRHLSVNVRSLSTPHITHMCAQDTPSTQARDDTTLLCQDAPSMMSRTDRHDVAQCHNIAEQSFCFSPVQMRTTSSSCPMDIGHPEDTHDWHCEQHYNNVEFTQHLVKALTAWHQMRDAYAAQTRHAYHIILSPATLMRQDCTASFLLAYIMHRHGVRFYVSESTEWQFLQDRPQHDHARNVIRETKHYLANTLFSDWFLVLSRYDMQHMMRTLPGEVLWVCEPSEAITVPSSIPTCSFSTLVDHLKIVRALIQQSIDLRSQCVSCAHAYTVLFDRNAPILMSALASRKCYQDFSPNTPTVYSSSAKLEHTWLSTASSSSQDNQEKEERTLMFPYDNLYWADHDWNHDTGRDATYGLASDLEHYRCADTQTSMALPRITTLMMDFMDADTCMSCDGDDSVSISSDSETMSCY